MALAERTATVQWQGTLVRGSGSLRAGSGAGGELPLDWASRSEDAHGTTSPEELLAAAHAACFATTLALHLARSGTEPERIDVGARCSLDTSGDWYRITRVDLEVSVDAPGLEDLGEALREADAGCAISRALRGDVEVSVRAAAPTSAP